jgi:pantoate--beta-alanine ligase
LPFVAPECRRTGGDQLRSMQKIESVSAMRLYAAQLKREGQTTALVMTSGALHAGHAALLTAAKTAADVVVVAAFPNPLAFGPSENFAGYPRCSEADLKLCADLKADVVFCPPQEEMLPNGFSTFVTEEAVSKPLCGVSRPTHFRGVTTLTAKLLNIVRPEVVVMGQRDAQQIAVVRKMITDLCFGAEILVVPTVRDADGLALAVKNKDMTSGQRQEALAVHQSLLRAQQMVASGVRSSDRVIAEVTHLLGERRRVRVIYVAMVDPNTMEPVRQQIVAGQTLLAIAVWVDEVRLIDNILL